MDNDIDFLIDGTSLFQNEITLLEDIVAILLGAMQILHDYLEFKKKNRRSTFDRRKQYGTINC